MQNFPHVASKSLPVRLFLGTGKGARLAFGVACLRYFRRGIVNLLPIGPMTMETLILASLCVGAAGGMRLRVFVLFPLIILCLIVVTAWGLAQNQTGLVDHGDEFCWLSLPSTRLFGRLGAQLSHDCRSTKPTRALATGSPVAP